MKLIFALVVLQISLIHAFPPVVAPPQGRPAVWIKVTRDPFKLPVKLTDVGEGPKNIPVDAPYGLPGYPEYPFPAYMRGGPPPGVPTVVSHERYSINPLTGAYEALPASPYLGNVYPYL